MQSHQQFSESDEGRHPFPDEPLWQESGLLHWYDEKAGIGGFHRIGHEPNNGDGRAVIWSYLFSRDGGWSYRCCTDMPLSSTDVLPLGFAAGRRLSFAYENGTALWNIDDGNVRAAFECTNLHPVVDPFPNSDTVIKTRLAHHFEGACHVRGQVTFDGQSTPVDCFGYRDHSWGRRDWQNGLLNHRWFTGSLGPDLSFAAVMIQSNDGRLASAGYVARRGQVSRAKTVDAVPFMEIDGLTHRGGFIRMMLEDGEAIDIRLQAVAGVIFTRGAVAMVEMMCVAEGHGLRGYCDAEISTNPRNGRSEILHAVNARIEDGIASFRPIAVSY